MDSPHRGFGRQSLLTLAALVVVIAGLRAASSLLPPFLLATLLSVLMAPLVLWLERRRVPAVLSTIVVLVVVLALLGGFGVLVTKAFAGYEEAVPGYRRAMTERLEVGLDWLGDHGVDITADQIGRVLNPEALMDVSMNFLGGLVGAVSYTALVVFTMIFILLEFASIPGKLRVVLEDPDGDLSYWSGMLTEIQRYLAIKTVVSAVTGLTATAMLTILGVDFPLLWGMVAFALNYIPTIGSMIAAMPAILIALIQPDLGPGIALIVAIGYLVMNALYGSIIEPQLLGRRLGLSPLVVFISLVFWIWVWGPLGGLLSVPLTVVIRLLLERSDELHWVAILLGSRVEAEEEEKISPDRRVLAKIRLPKDVPLEAIVRTDMLARVRFEEGDPSASVVAAPRVAPDGDTGVRSDRSDRSDRSEG